MRMLSKIVMSAGLVSLVSTMALAAEKTRPPYPHYWISVATTNQSIPGMSEEMSGMASMFGGRGAAFGPRRTLQLQLEGPREVAEPKAEHLIPPGQKMGDSLPLITPKQEKTEYQPEQRGERPEKYEKPKARMLIYWGCGENVAKGQPRVIDTAKMSAMDFGKALSGRSGTRQIPPSPHKGWTYGDWPNSEDRKDVPKDASLVGEHQLKGSYLPDNIRFSLDQKRDFMAPVSFSAISKTASGAWPFKWQQVPTAIGYFATAMGHNQKTGETIFWSSSEVPETGFGLMDYLTPHDVQRFIREKVLMPTSRTSCTIPAGVFKDVDGAMLQFMAYGEELNLVHPPKPKDPKQPWNPQWSVKVRLKSTGSSPLVEAEERGSRSSKKRPAADDGAEQEQQPSDNKKGGGMMDGLKGMFGF
ncbi:hypothetical protein [Trichlorobacter lovleyi]|uniref:Uncharacterized protein n=1 Tax=Trichlorobacter lovleyi (strain ATCC BAA-1151 / DSM 17278 / SZ) TaxID=398767 RepID=B3E5K8_TRIL1|nr:hypothetical protein [Trichlorobacter lovleyi]ACD94679.1 conserved hypothetical protein [Trichlorobacter lovleyi SZ]